MKQTWEDDSQEGSLVFGDGFQAASEVTLALGGTLSVATNTRYSVSLDPSASRRVPKGKIHTRKGEPEESPKLVVIWVSILNSHSKNGCP